MLLAFYAGLAVGAGFVLVLGLIDWVRTIRRFKATTEPLVRWPNDGKPHLPSDPRLMMEIWR